MAKVLLGMSGGMDSACAAKLLQAAGHEVIGALLVMHEYTDASGFFNSTVMTETRPSASYKVPTVVSSPNNCTV